MLDSFGSALRQLRQERDLSLAKFAARLGWAPSMICMVEAGQRQPRLDFVVACDDVLDTKPILTTLFGLTGKDNDVNRRALLSGLSAAVAVGAVGSAAAMADIIRLDLQGAGGVDEDWDGTIGDFQNRLTLAPTQQLGDELLVKMLVARQQLAEKQTPEIMRASAHLGLLFGLFNGYQGNINTGRNYYRTSGDLAARSGDPDTHVFVLARIASAGPYQGLTYSQTDDHIKRALVAAKDRPSVGVLEAHAAAVHLAALTGDVGGGRASMRRMWDVAHQLPAGEGPRPDQRAASFSAYLEGRVGTMPSAEKAWREADLYLRDIPLWHVEAQMYYALAQVRHGDLDGGTRNALEAAKRIPFSGVRVVRLAVDDILRALPFTYNNDTVDQLRQHAAGGPRPWELIST